MLHVSVSSSVAVRAVTPPAYSQLLEAADLGAIDHLAGHVVAKLVQGVDTGARPWALAVFVGGCLWLLIDIWRVVRGQPRSERDRV
jgi:hypothetical protein